MGQFLSTAPPPPLVVPPPASYSASIPDSPQCPMRTPSSATPIPSKSGPAQCPVPHDPSALNPHNNMPVLPQSPAPNQVGALPVTRVTSSIPRAPESSYPGEEKRPSDVATSNWEYPSPQQFYNALIRKGWNTPEEHVEAMVLIHNRLNEDAWNEVLKWESRVGGGAAEAAKLELAEFSGIHGTLSHKARLYQFARHYFPSRFRFTPPFDRHDWIVRRPRTGKKLRYVIDYYSSRKTVLGDPEFHLDVRPAMDSLGNIKMRLLVAVGDVFSGVVPRQASGIQVPGLLNHTLRNSVYLLLFASFTLTIFLYSPYKTVLSL